MSDRSRVIPIKFHESSLPLPNALPEGSAQGELRDRRQRRIHDLRISVTDRCNFRCSYCMPKSVFDRNYPFLPHAALLSFEEIRDVAAGALRHGVEKLRITGGEPLLRRHLERLIDMLAALRTVHGKKPELTLTTNGALLARKAKDLRAAGLDRITVSMDALDDELFRRMNDVDFPVEQVLEGIEAAAAAGFSPIKINMVVKAGTNDHEVVRMAQYFKNTPHILRFIEYMDVGASNGWKLDEVLPAAELLARIHAVLPIEPLGANYPGEVAKRWRYCDGQGEIGVIASVTQAFCSTCTRARLSTDGKIFTCLFADQGFDLRPILRERAPDQRPGGLDQALRWIWEQRTDRYSEIRTQATAQRRKVEMSFIGG